MTDIIKQIDIKKLTSNELNKVIKKLNENPDFEKQVLKMHIVDKAKEKIDNDIKKNSFNYESKKKLFLDSFKSDNTKKIYSKGLEILENWLKENDKHILNLTAYDIDLFIQYLSDNNLLFYKTGISSFLNKLERYNEIIRNNFHGAKIPKKESKELKVMSNNDYEKIMSTFKYEKKRGSYKRTNKVMDKWNIIFTLLFETGLRISAVKTIQVKQNNIISYFSKGKAGQIEISKELSQKLRTLDLSKITENSIQIALRKACQKAGLNEVYYPHSIRHLFAVNFYNETKDIYRLKELLNHSSISITENYLKSLKVIS